MLRKTLLAAGALLGVAITLQACATAPDHLFNRPGGDAQALIDDIGACAKIANDPKARTQYVYSDPKYGVTGQAGAAFGAGFAQGLAEVKVHNQIVDSCLTERGWTRVQLSEQDRRQLGETPRTPAARKTFIADWMSTHPVDAAAAPSNETARPPT